MKALAHVVTVALGCVVLVGIPLIAFGDKGALSAMMSGSDVDLVSSATTIQDAPSGAFRIYLNAELHPDEDVLDDWETFFSGESAPLIMEDISCTVIKGDHAGIEMAESLQSRLPENQMKLHVEEGPLAVSKAEQGIFDVLVISEEAADAYMADTLSDRPSVRVISR